MLCWIVPNFRVNLLQFNLELFYWVCNKFKGVRGLRAILEGASMRNCNFKDPGGKSANLEGANLKGACLEDSDMGGINLRIANCKNANLKNCDLRAAVLAGADLEVSVRESCLQS